jgi:hypothetical protein
MIFGFKWCLAWIPWMIIFLNWWRRYNIRSKEYEFEMPLMKKNIFVSKWKDIPARIENSTTKSK